MVLLPFTEKNMLRQVVLMVVTEEKVEMLFSELTKEFQLLWTSVTKENTVLRTEQMVWEKNVMVKTEKI